MSLMEFGLLGVISASYITLALFLVGWVVELAVWFEHNPVLTPRGKKVLGVVVFLTLAWVIVYCFTIMFYCITHLS